MSQNRSAVYQIDFTAVDAGKRIASSKRRIRWRFGFTNLDAMAAGETGTACRGEEHDITLVWSLTSGKRLLLADGQEVHYSNSRAQVFDFSWTMRGNHALKVVAHATLPMNSHPNFRQYDLFVDGMSFFSMPKVYRLGLTDSTPIQEPTSLDLAVSTRTGTYGNYNVGRYNTAPAPKRSEIVEIEAPHNEQEEEAYLREAIKASLQESQNAKTNDFTSSASVNNRNYSEDRDEGDLLIDFMSEPGPVPAPRPTVDSFAMVPKPGAPGPNSVVTSSFNSMPVVPAQTQSNPIVDPFAPVPSSANASIPFSGNGSSSAVSSLGTPATFTAPPASAPPPAPVASTPFDTMPARMAPPPPPAPIVQPPPAVPLAPMMAPAPAPAPASVPIASAPIPIAPAPSVPAPIAPVEPTPAEAPAPASTQPANGNILTMAPQSTSLGTDANAAYAKFAQMDQFELVKPTTPAAPNAAINPFDEPAATKPKQTAAPTLAGMKAMNQGNGEKKEIMKNAMVPAQTQNGNWSGYGYGAPLQTAQQPMSMGMGMGTGMGMTGQQQYGMSVPPPAMNGGQSQYGYPQQPQQQQYGMQQGQPFQQPGYGQHSQAQQQQHF